MKDTWVLAHDAQVLVLGNLVDPHVEAFGQSDLVLLLCWLGSWLPWGGSHREGTWRNVGQFHARAIGEFLGRQCWLAAELAEEQKRKKPQYDSELKFHVRDKGGNLWTNGVSLSLLPRVLMIITGTLGSAVFQFVISRSGEFSQKELRDRRVSYLRKSATLESNQE